MTDRADRSGTALEATAPAGSLAEALCTIARAQGIPGFAAALVEEGMRRGAG